MNNLKKDWQSQILLRLGIVKWIIIVLIFGIFARLVYIQFYDKDISSLSTRVHKKLISTEIVEAQRGRIVARDGSPLATTVERQSIFLDLASHGFDNLERFSEQSDSLAKCLSAFFGEKSAKWYYDTLMYLRKRSIIKDSVGYNIEDNRSLIGRVFNTKNFDTVPIYKTTRHHTYTRLFRDVDANEWDQLRRYPILNGNMGIVYHQTDKQTRIYPHGNLAMRVIGRTDVEKPYGIEHIYRDTLAGKNGVVHLQYMAPNFNAKIENDTLKTIPAIHGADVVTTLDIELQDVANRALRQQLQSQGGQWGTTVVMECATGDILAMANLYRNSKGECYEGINYAICMAMEPGSTMKLATTITLLDKGGMSPEKLYNSGYGKKIKVGKYNEVADSHPIGTRKNPKINLKTAFAESANVYFLKAVLDHFEGRETEYYQSLCSLHLHKHPALTEFDPQRVHLPKPGSEKWYKSTLGLLSYGYGLEITPMQTLTLYNAVANGGKMVAPRIVRRIERDGVVLAENPVKVLNNQICSPKTLALVREYLEEVALSGTAKAYFGLECTPFRVGAKTGTSNTAKGTTYKEAYHLGSMVTYLPADNPRYTIITAIYKQKGKGSIFGAALAGPVQQHIAHYLYNREREWAEPLIVSDVKQLPTDVKGGNIEHIGTVASHFDLATAYTSSPTGWGTTTTGISSISLQPTSADRKVVPDVKGMGLADALFLLESRGLKVSFSGSGKVVYQSIDAGNSFKQGSTITIKLE